LNRTFESDISGFSEVSVKARMFLLKATFQFFGAGTNVEGLLLALRLFGTNF